AFNTGGVTAGADYRFQEHFAAGLSVGYLHGHASIYAPASGTVDDTSVRFGAYAVGWAGGFHGDLYLGGASNDFTTNRGIQCGAETRPRAATPSGTEFNPPPSVGYDYRNWLGTFSPFASLNYDRLRVGGFTESGADTLDLTVAAQTVESLQSTLGLRFSDVL